MMRKDINSQLKMLLCLQLSLATKQKRAICNSIYPCQCITHPITPPSPSPPPPSTHTTPLLIMVCFLCFFFFTDVVPSYISIIFCGSIDKQAVSLREQVIAHAPSPSQTQHARARTHGGDFCLFVCPSFSLFQGMNNSKGAFT